MEDQKIDQSRYFLRWTYLGFETGSNIFSASSALDGVIAEGMEILKAGGDGVYHYLNVYRDKKFIGRIGKEGYVSAE